MPKENTHIYLDYGATTPIDERAWEAMLPYFREDFGNPASIHHFGQRAENALENSRRLIAKALGASAGQVIFTSGATESDNLALRGSAFASRRKRGANHLVISGVEHDAISQTAQQLTDFHDFELSIVPPDEKGQISSAAVMDHIQDNTAIVSIIMANNEVGTINPLADIAKICIDKGIPLHTDAVQAAAYLPINVEDIGVDMLSLGAHKFYGPKGIGALYIRDQSLLSALQTGGGHEFNLRAGTPNTAFIVGMAKAFDIVHSNIGERADFLQKKRDKIITEVLEAIPDAKLSGHHSQRLPNHASFVFKGVDGNALLMHLDAADFACSSGSACKTGDPEPSNVLIAMKIDPVWALGSLRVTVGMHTSDADINAFVEVLPKAVSKLRTQEASR